jgi:hypothetical protein
MVGQAAQNGNPLQHVGESQNTAVAIQEQLKPRRRVTLLNTDTKPTTVTLSNMAIWMSLVLAGSRLQGPENFRPLQDGTGNSRRLKQRV